MSGHWANIKEAGALNGMRIMAFIYRIFGKAVFNIILVPVMAYFYLRRSEQRQASKKFLRKVRDCYPDALPDQPVGWLSYRHFLSFGRSLLDKFIAWSQMPTDIVVDPRKRDRLLEAVNSGVGCLVIGSHFGNLEYSRGISLQHPSLVFNILIYDQHAQKFTALIDEVKNDTRMNLIQVTDIDMALAFELKEKVKRGEWLMIAGDRVPVNEVSRVCEAPFFGENAKFPVGPYVLANLLGCPVYLLHCFLEDGEYRIAVDFFEEKFQIDRKDRETAYQDAVERYAAALERQVARHPLQWFNFYDFWHQSSGPEKLTDSHVNP
jgi:predicted LPLAT superfamily acyltransferase